MTHPAEAGYDMPMRTAAAHPPCPPARQATVAVLYLLAMLLTWWLQERQPAYPLWWPATGVAIAGLVVCGTRVWPALAAAVIGGEWILRPHGLTDGLFAAAGALLGLGLGHWLAKRFLRTGAPCSGFRLLGLFLLLFGAVVPFALAGARILALAGAGALPTAAGFGPWVTQVLAQATGTLSVAPLLIVLWNPPPEQPARGRLETASLHLLNLLCLYLLLSSSGNQLAVAFGMLMASPLMWALYRFSSRQPLAILALDAFAVSLASRLGIGPFNCPEESACIVGMQVYVLILTICTLLAIVMMWKALAARDELKLASTVFENTLEGIVITDPHRTIRSVNSAFLDTSGYDREELIGLPIDELTSHYLGKEFFVDLFREISRIGRWQGEVWSRRADNSVAPEWLNIKVVRDARGEPMHYICLFSDVAHQQRIQDQVHRLAYYDVLTNLPNRQLFNDRLELALNQAARRGTRLAVCFLDLDRFKNINDTLGHGVGDEVLKVVAEHLNACVRKTDTLSRLGGDEFTIILQDIQSRHDIALIASKILDALNSAVKAGDHELFLTTSIGIALYPDHGNTPDELLKHADTAMYRSKDLGGNNYQLFDPSMSEPVSQGLAIENALRRAIDEDRISVVYQTQYRLADNQVIGVEALARWFDPELGQVPTEEFIKIAENTGLIHQLGELVLHHACRDIVAWRKQGLDELRVAINISAIQLSRKGLAETFDDVLNYFEIAPSRIELEITESALMENTQQMSDTLERLSGMGFHLAIDDFGTGYSSLSYLKRLPVERLKIDRSFVTDIPDDANDAAIAAAIIAMGHSLNLHVIAEGVESRAQMDFLREHRCDEIQGNLLNVPMPADDILTLLKVPGE